MLMDWFTEAGGWFLLTHTWLMITRTGNLLQVSRNFSIQSLLEITVFCGASEFLLPRQSRTISIKCFWKSFYHHCRGLAWCLASQVRLQCKILWAQEKLFGWSSSADISMVSDVSSTLTLLFQCFHRYCRNKKSSGERLFGRWKFGRTSRTHSSYRSTGAYFSWATERAGKNPGKHCRPAEPPMAWQPLSETIFKVLN